MRFFWIVTNRIVLILLILALEVVSVYSQELIFPIVDTGQEHCYGDGQSIPCPQAGEDYYGQDAQHQGNAFSYQDNGDGTVSDRVTGLMWVKARGEKMTWDDAVAGASACRVGGYSDWRMPTIKELYSLINFNGRSGRTAGDSLPYLDAAVFDFAYGEGGTGIGNRLIDCQDWSSTTYVSATMDGNPTAFGVNFADGRIKGYGKSSRRSNRKTSTHYVRYVRGNPSYGKNDLNDNGDGTVIDRATDLTWDQDDSGKGMDWKTALAWVAAKNDEKYKGHSDWRLPNAKEMQSLVDYNRSPDTTQSAAIDPLFRCTSITNEGGNVDFPFFWTSTTHLEGGAVYIAFGRALGFMQTPPDSGNYQLMDVHGAGAQRSDPKSGDPSLYPRGRGPQGDVIRIDNFVRCVRGGTDKVVSGQGPDRSARYEPRSAGNGEPSGLGANQGEGKSNTRQMGQGRHHPPAEAIQACSGHSEGDTVNFTTPRGDTLSCHCVEMNGVLFAKPDNGPSGP
jgi:hypothetical protein